MEFEADAVAAQSECRFLQATKREVASTVAQALPRRVEAEIHRLLAQRAAVRLPEESWEFECEA